MKGYITELLLIGVVFFFVGTIFCMNDILLPIVKEIFMLNYFQATMIQLSFYIVYLILPLSIAKLLEKLGYKKSLVFSLLVSATGCAFIYPSYLYNSYFLVLAGIFVVSSGIVAINLIANPLATLLGDPQHASVRINFVQAFSRAGYSVVPLAGNALIANAEGEQLFYRPYLLLFFSLIFLAILLYFSGIPRTKPTSTGDFAFLSVFKNGLKYPKLMFGAMAMFIYVGAEAGIAGFFINYLKEVASFTYEKAVDYLFYYNLIASVMGFAGVYMLRFIKPNKLLAAFGMANIFLLILCVFFITEYNALALVALGAFLSVMFPTIFGLAIAGLGGYTNQGSALLIMSVVGGAIFPPVQGMLADYYSVQFSFLLLIFCFVILSLYGWFFEKLPGGNQNSSNQT